MYIAKRYIRAMGPAGKVISYLPEDVIPDFASWPPVSQTAHLNQQLVVERPDVEVPPLRQAEVAEQVVAEAAVPVGEAETVYTPTVPFCRDCERSFKDMTGLRIHRTRAHKQPAPRAEA